MFIPESRVVFWHQTGCVLLGNCPQPSNSLQLSLVTEAWTTYKWKGSRVRQEVTQNQFDQHADNHQAWTKKHPPNHKIMFTIWTVSFQIKSKRQNKQMGHLICNIFLEKWFCKLGFFSGLRKVVLQTLTFFWLETQKKKVGYYKPTFFQVGEKWLQIERLLFCLA